MYHGPERAITLVIGKTGTGKTRWTKAHLASLQRVLIMDTQREHDGILFENLDELIGHVMRYRTFRVRTEYVDDFPLLCAVATGAGSCTLVVEEAQRVLPSSRQDLPGAFADIVYRGRHAKAPGSYEGVSLVLISQRCSTVHIAARSQWNRIILFNVTEDADVAWVENQAGIELPEARSLSYPTPQRPNAPCEYYDISIHGAEKKALDTFRKPRETIQVQSSSEPEPLEGEDEETET